MSRDQLVGRHPKPHIWNQLSQIACSLYKFMGLRWRLRGSLHGSTPIVKRFSAEKNSKTRQKRAQNGGFSGKGGLNVKFLFSISEKAHPCAEPRCLAYYAWKSVQGSRLKVVGSTQINKPSKHFWCANSHIRGKKPIEGSWFYFVCE